MALFSTYLGSTQVIATDGSKFLAVNSSQRNYSQRKLEKALKEIDAKLQQCQSYFEAFLVQ